MGIDFSKQALLWLEIILKERFGHNFKLTCPTPYEIQLYLADHDKVIRFDNLLPVFHESRSDFSCGSWCPEKEGYNSVLEMDLPIPGISEVQCPLIEKTEDGYTIGYDILGLTYWMLSRLEEVGRTDLDEHQRFPATLSHAYKNKYLDRPVVDEWLDILGQVINKCWPEIILKKHQFRINLTHDVDSVSRYAFQPFLGYAKRVANDLFLKRNIKMAVYSPLIRYGCGSMLSKRDPYNSFEWLMSLSEKKSLKSTFYFMVKQSFRKYDADYDIESPVVKQILKNIDRRGHFIGLHSSYLTVAESGLLQKELQKLQSVCSNIGVKKNICRVRAHYLRWKTPDSFIMLDNAGIKFDSTLGYADKPGFRSGTAFEYYPFDLKQNKIIQTKITPLIVMEGSVIGNNYMAMGYSKDALEYMSLFKERCKKVSGIFTILWHNCNLDTKTKKKFYESIISA